MFTTNSYKVSLDQVVAKLEYLSDSRASIIECSLSTSNDKLTLL